MVKKVDLDGLTEISKTSRMTIALFYSKGCSVCKKQEDDLVDLEKSLKSHGVTFVRLNVDKLKKAISKLPKEDPRRNLKIEAVPTIMIWIDGVNVGFRFQRDGKIFSQINGYINPTILLNKIANLLNQFSGSHA